MWNYQNTDELCHYGVIGMKWGIRKQQKYAGDSNNITKEQFRANRKAGLYKDNREQRKTDRSAARNRARYESADNFVARARKGYGKKTLDYVNAKGYGRLFAEKLLLGGQAQNMYNKYRAEGGTVIGSAVKARVEGALNGLTLGTRGLRRDVGISGVDVFRTTNRK